MEINLSWDLFVIVFFTVIIAYTFIVGRNQCLKIIISTYIAILAADGVGNLVVKYFIGQKPVIETFDFSSGEGSWILIKVIMFIFSIVIITTKGKFQINVSAANSSVMSIIFSLTYGILSAGLITSTILIYASGTSLVQENSFIMNKAILDIYEQSKLVRLMMNNYNIWFSLPAVAFVVSSFFGKEE